MKVDFTCTYAEPLGRLLESLGTTVRAFIEKDQCIALHVCFIKTCPQTFNHGVVYISWQV